MNTLQIGMFVSVSRTVGAVSSLGGSNRSPSLDSGAPLGGAPPVRLQLLAPSRRVGSAEGSADQNLLRRAEIGQCAVDADVVVRHPEAAHVVGRHGAGAAAQV